MQQHSLLATKLYIPPIRPELVSRPRLIERLNAGLPTRGGLSRTPNPFSRALTANSAYVLLEAFRRHPQAEQTWYLEEQGRPGEFMPIMEDEMGTYIMNSRDLRAVEHVHRLVAIGVDSLKIEGRTKSHYYTARTTQVYRRAIDDAAAGRPFDAALLDELERLANRGYTDGFLQRHESRELQNYRAGISRNTQQQFVGEITGRRRQHLEVLAKNKFGVGDELELLSPQGNLRFRLEALEDLEGNALEEAPGGGWEVRIEAPPGDYQLGLLTKILPR